MGIIDISLKAGDGICKFFVGKQGDARIAQCKKRFFGITVGIATLLFFLLLWGGRDPHGVV